MKEEEKWRKEEVRGRKMEERWRKEEERSWRRRKDERWRDGIEKEEEALEITGCHMSKYPENIPRYIANKYQDICK